MDEQHPLSYGYMGMHGWKHVNKAIQSADLLIALGMRFDDRVTGTVSSYAPHARIIHVDIDPSEIGKNVAVDVPIVGDVGSVLRALIAAVPEVDPADRAEYLAQLAEWRAESEATPWHGSGGWRQGILTADYVISRLGELTGHDATLVSDVGQHQMWLARYAGFRRPNSHLSSGGLGTMGYGLPAAMGAALGRPDKETWAIVGDGGLQMTTQEMLTVAVERIPLRVALMDNKRLGMIRQWQEIVYGGNYHSSDLPAPKWDLLARGLWLGDLQGHDARGGRRRHPRRPGARWPGPRLVRDPRDPERVPDDAGRQGALRPHRGLGRARQPGGEQVDGRHERPHRRAGEGRAQAALHPGSGQTHRHVLVVLVNNQPGVLNRVASMVRSRNFNIESLAVGHTERPDISRMTITLRGDDFAVEQMAKQLYRLIDVLKVQDLPESGVVEHELALVKVRATESRRGEILRIIELYKGRILDVGPETVIVEHSGTEQEIDSLVALLAGFGIKEMVRTGTIALGRGSGAIDVEAILRAGPVPAMPPEA